jgi:hypothetical protein
LFEQDIITIIDKIALIEEVNTFIKRRKNSTSLRRKQNQRKYLLQKKKTHSPE